MPLLIIPDLQAKYGVLIARNVVADKDDLATRLGRSRKTLDSWAHGSDTRPQGLIPFDRTDALIDLFVKCFPPTMDREQIVEALEQPIIAFQTRLQQAWSIGFDQLLASYANDAAGRLLAKGDDLSLVEIETDQPGAHPVIKRGVWFRLEFNSDIHAPIALAFQRTAGLTARLPAGLASDRATILVPPIKPDGNFGYMRERNHLGAHDFIVLHLAIKLPAPIDCALPTNELTPRDALDQLSEFLVGLPRKQWRLFRLSISIDEQGDDHA